MTDDIVSYLYFTLNLTLSYMITMSTPITGEQLFVIYIIFII